MGWTYDQNFNSLITGDLNGQDGWSANVAWDVQTSVVQEGAKAISCVGGSSNRNANRTIPSTTSGNVVFYMRATHSGGTHTGATFRARDSSLTGRFDVRFTQNSNNLQLVGTTAVTLVSGYSVDTWYKVEVEYDCSGNTARARINDGSWSSSVTLTGSGNITDLFLQTNDAPSPAGTYYFDNIYDSTPVTAKGDFFNLF